MLQHLLALVQDEMFQVLERQLLVPDESQNPAWSPNHDVGAVALQNLLILGNGKTSEKYSDLHTICLSYYFSNL